MDLKITVDDTGAAQLFIATEHQLRNLSPIMAAIAGEVDNLVQESFAGTQDPVTGASWPELRPATIADRARKGYSASEVLQRSGILKGSVITDSDDHGVTTSTGGVEYALHHFFGAPKANIPQRRFAGISPEDQDEFSDMIQNFILNG